MTALLALLLMAGVASSATTPEAVTSAAAAEPREAALVLSRILNSEANIIGSSVEDAKSLALAQELMTSQPDLVQLEKAHPGIGVALAQAIIPITNRSMRERLPELQRRQALLYGATFSDAELATLTDFYSSPTGRKLIAAMFASLKPTAMVAEARTSPDFTISSASVLSDIHATQKDIMAQMDANDQLELIKLGTSGLAARLKEMGTKTQALTLTWMNETAPWEDAATSKAAGKVMKRFHVGDDE